MFFFSFYILFKQFFTLILLSICSNILSTPTESAESVIATKIDVDADDDIAEISSIREKRDYFQSQHQNLYPTNDYNQQYNGQHQQQQQYARQYNNYNVDANAPILRQINEQGADGSYNYE